MSLVSLALAFTLAPALALGPAVTDGPPDEAHRQALEHYRAGQQLLYSESFAEAAREFETAVRLDPQLVLAHYGLGQASMSMKDFPQAVKAFTAARDTYLRLAAGSASDSVRADQRREEEIQELKDQLRYIQGPGGNKMLQRDNAVLRLEGRIRELEESRRRGPASAPEAPAEFSLALGSAYFRSGSLPDAEREYLAAVKARPKFGEAQNNLAVVLMLQGRLKEAKERMEAAEKAGFKVNPQFKADLEKKLKGE